MILCAALKLNDDLVIPCYRHCDGYESLYKLDLKANDYNIVEGFISVKGIFLDRTAAFIDAINCGQLSAVTRQYKQDNFETELYNEDLY